MTRYPFLNHFKLPKNFLSDCETNAQPLKETSEPILQNTIYLDYASSTPLDLRVFQAMEPWLFSYFGNSANHIHSMGELAKHALESSRITIANLIGCHQEEIIFTSSATESNNLLLRGLIEHPLQKRKKIVYCATEHSSISATIANLSENLGARLGYEFCELPVDQNGQINMTYASKIIDEHTLCVCVMDVNNETGIIQTTLPQIEQLAHKAGALLHVDAVQGFARHNQFALGVNYDTAVISSAKIYGPRGAATLIIKKRRPRILLSPQLIGGGHEFGLRSSTTNTAAIVGFATACELQIQEQHLRINYIQKLENIFINELEKELAQLSNNSMAPCFYGLNTEKVKGILSLAIPNVNAMKLLENTPRVCASVGSACKTLQATASHVLLAMGVNVEQALSTFRVSFGLGNNEKDVSIAAKLLAKSANDLRQTSATLF